MKAVWQGRLIQLGSRRWCGGESQEHTAQELWLAIDGKAVEQFVLQDELRPDAMEVVRQLHEAGIATAILSGDRIAPVEAIAAQLGITTYAAELTPVQKCEYLQAWKDESEIVLMVGDGLNDAPSLASAYVSMSPSTAMDITQNTADIVFQGDALQPVMRAWNIAVGSTRLVKQSFVLAVLYNLIAIPVAVMGFVTPMIAAIAMSGSSLVVIGNSFRLTRGQK